MNKFFYITTTIVGSFFFFVFNKYDVIRKIYNSIFTNDIEHRIEDNEFCYCRTAKNKYGLCIDCKE